MQFVLYAIVLTTLVVNVDAFGYHGMLNTKSCPKGIVFNRNRGSCQSYVDDVQGLTPSLSNVSRNSRTGAMRMSTSGSDAKNSKNVVVVSPSGGIGEISATTLAREGNNVRWFVVDSNKSGQNRKIAFPKETWDAIKETGGVLDITGGDASSILLPDSNPSSSLPFVEQWCAMNSMASSTIDAFVVSLDEGDDSSDDEEEVGDAVKQVTKLACSKLPSSVKRIQIVPAPLAKEDGGEEETSGGWLGGLLGGNRISLREALSASSTSSGEVAVSTFRHGALFGAAESNLDATPFVGGPRRDPILRDEFLYRSVLLSKTRRVKKVDALRTSRLSLAGAISQLVDADATISTNIPKDITLTSLRGPAPPTDEEWSTIFQRLATSAPASLADGVVVFESDFASVPSVPKLADWINLKWAPAVLGSYDIAGIRIGARPVCSTRVESTKEGTEAVDIVWQELINFEDTVTVGKMTIELTNNGIVASRKVIDGSVGMKLESSKPFPGEKVLVRRLADAAGQAVEKGLATKAKAKKAVPTAVVARPPIAADPVGAAASESSTSSQASSGPRRTGAKRSTQRPRGTMRTEDSQ